jgi:hypothetical protein
MNPPPNAHQMVVDLQCRDRVDPQKMLKNVKKCTSNGGGSLV